MRFWNCVITGNHDYWYLWLEAPYFGRNLMTILGHVIVDDHGSKGADYRNSCALSGGGDLRCVHWKFFRKAHRFSVEYVTQQPD